MLCRKLFAESEKSTVFARLVEPSASELQLMPDTLKNKRGPFQRISRFLSPEQEIAAAAGYHHLTLDALTKRNVFRQLCGNVFTAQFGQCGKQ